MRPDRHIGLGTVDVTERDKALVKHVLCSGHISPGPMQRQFEDAVAERHGKRFATFVNSGQSALHLSLEALKRTLDVPTLKVCCPAVTYISTLHAVWNAQCDIVLADVDPIDFMLDVRGRTGYFDAVMQVDLFGKAWTPEGLGVPVVEDACEAIGAPGVGYGDIVCLSFYASHSISTGVGGMVLTNDADIDSLVKRLANHGRANPGDIYTAKRSEGDFREYDLSRQFVFTDEGWSYKNSDLNAALGLAQIERLTDILARRWGNAMGLLERLAPFADRFQFADPAGHTFQMFPIICREPRIRDDLAAWLAWNGIESRHAMPITTQPVVIDRLGVKPGQFPVADHIANDGLYIGCHQGLRAEDLDYVADAFAGFFVAAREKQAIPLG